VGQVEVDVFEVVFVRAADADGGGSLGHGQR
jgi:hypothetical protein